MPKRTMACRSCGSDDIVRDAWACWSIERQEWELGEIFDHTFCLACENDCSIHEADVNPPAATSESSLETTQS